MYLSDVSRDRDKWSPSEWLSQFRSSRWFTRGWTLQELIAPPVVDFFAREGTWLGTKSSLEREIHQITRIPAEALRGEISKFDIEERLLWADKRETTKPEDAVYCLFGLVDIYMTPRYGEELHRARARFRHKIQMASNPGGLTAGIDLPAPKDQASHLNSTGDANGSRKLSHLVSGRATLDYEGRQSRALEFQLTMIRASKVAVIS